MIEVLAQQKHACTAFDDSVCFCLSTVPAYGKLLGIDGKQFATQREKKNRQINLADEYDQDAVHYFTLWKANKAQNPTTGWRIESSAMLIKYLGKMIDIQRSGIDFCFFSATAIGAEHR
jgi:cysteinyl-tRNA synthetase